MSWFNRDNKEMVDESKQRRPVILITGCSSGIGLALGGELWKNKGYRVIITARNSSIENLKKHFPREIHDNRFLIKELDVANKNSREKLINEIYQLWGGIDILVNNAGICFRSTVEHMSSEEEEESMNTNYLGVMALTRLVLPHMRSVGRGKIINVSSISGRLGMPTMASYSASKHALEGASEALWFEMKPFGINVSLVQPGFIRSNSVNKVKYSWKATQATKVKDIYQDYYGFMAPFVDKMMKMSFTEPAHAAKTILNIIKKRNPPLRISATFDALFFYYLQRWVPRMFLPKLLFMILPSSKWWARKFSNKRLARPLFLMKKVKNNKIKNKYRRVG